MGNSNTKESRQDPRVLRLSGSSERGQSSSQGPAGLDPTGRSRGRAGRTDIGGLLGITSGQAGSSSGTHERRETRQEREARRLERERQARLVERERSMREEHVDGGYLVTLGTYVGPEDFNKSIVRQLQIDRRLAPFWRGLQDFSDTWTEYQLVAAVRGLEVPPADQPPPENFLPRPPPSPNPTSSTDPPAKPATSQNFLAVPTADRSGGSSSTSTSSTSALTPTPGPSAASASASIPAGSLAGTSSPNLPSPTAPSPPRGSSSPFKPRAKALAAALSVASRNGSSTDLTPREINLPHDPFVNGQPIEVYLYKDSIECPICFLNYPPYLNHTRCCDQPICSECFVQIKRADPHYPEGHGDNHDNADVHPEEQAGQLTSEPSCCPYCQQSEFGVTYDPPPFRRGLVHSNHVPSFTIGSMGTAMSSSSSINSTLSPSPLASPTAGISSSTPGSRRRTQSLSATAPNVVTTDRVRPDWSTKLATQRAHIARRAAAATALHTAAFVIGNQESRSFRGRFSRRNTGNNHHESDVSPGHGQSDGGDGSSSTMEPGPRSSSGRGVGANTAAGPRNRMEDLEELMFREALRQSLATEEERQRKEEKEERKEAKRREKEERKAAKAALKQQQHENGSSLYVAGSASGQSSATGSSLSLSGLGIGGRRRGNSGASNLRVEASVANAIAASGSGAAGAAGGSGSGGAAAGGSTSPTAGSAPASSLSAPSAPSAPSAGPTNISLTSGATNVPATEKGKAVDRGPTSSSEPEGDSASSSTASTPPRVIPIPQPSAGPSHLRQMSSASSVSSSQADSAAGSYPNPSLHLQDPRASGLSLGSRSATSEDGAYRSDDRDPSTSTEPMFNFSSLAELVGVQLEGKDAGRRLSAIANDHNGTSPAQPETATPAAPSILEKSESPAPHGEHVEVAGGHDADEEPSARSQPPEVMITPGTPGPPNDFD